MMGENDRWAVLYCPKRGKARTMRHWGRIETCLKENGVDFDFVQSESPKGVSRLVKMLVSNGYKTIILVGGDSALNDAANSLMSFEAEVRGTISLGLIPNGMMNDFAHYWNIRENDLEGTIKMLKTHKVRKIDLGRIDYANSVSEKCHRYFLNCVNIGLISTIMNLRYQTHRFFGSRTLSFLFSFVLMSFQRLDYKMSIRINSETIKRRIMAVCIGNASGYGLTPNAVPYNGLLDVSLVYPQKTPQLFEGMCLFVTGKLLNHRSVHPYRTREVVVDKATKALVSIDGRLIKTPVGPYSITVEQEVINFIVP